MFNKIEFPTSPAIAGMVWMYDIETDKFYEIPEYVRDAALSAFDTWSETGQPAASPELTAALVALRAAFQKAKDPRPFDQVYSLPLHDLTARELLMIYEKGGTPTVSARVAVLELADRAQHDNRRCR